MADNSEQRLAPHLRVGAWEHKIVTSTAADRMAIELDIAVAAGWKILHYQVLSLPRGGVPGHDVQYSALLHRKRPEDRWPDTIEDEGVIVCGEIDTFRRNY